MNSGARPVALLTGGSGMLARAIAAALRAAGWEVAAPSKQEMDVRDPDSIHRFLQGWSGIELLINNAGLRRDSLIQKLAAADWDAVLDTNLAGAWRCARAVLPGMQAGGRGHIINIGSRTARHGVAGQTAYGAAKAGLLALTQSLAAEAGPYNIRVNAVLPGWMPTPFNADLPPAVHEAARLTHHLGRFNTPEATAAFILALQALPHTSGQIFQLDSRPGLWL
jgi:3-oxoacyl-[acyl-carrier protein] reductase